MKKGSKMNRLQRKRIRDGMNNPRTKKLLSDSKKGDKNPMKRPEVRKRVGLSSRGLRRGKLNGNWSGGTKDYTCEFCGKTFHGYFKRFCCHKCYSKWLIGKNIGENSSRWKGGVTSLALLIRHLPEMRVWKSKVFERDNWTCQTCSVRGVFLNAHHKYPFSEIIKENNIKSTNDARNCEFLWDTDNGVTLCVACHNLTKGRKFK